MLLDLRVGKIASQLLQRGEGAFLIYSHQPGIAGDIGRQDRREPPLDSCLRHRSCPHSRSTAYSGCGRVVTMIAPAPRDIVIKKKKPSGFSPAPSINGKPPRPIMR